MPAPDPNTRAHLEWLGFIQPQGLVVSAPALAKAGAILNRQDAEGQSRLAGCIRERMLDPRPFFVLLALFASWAAGAMVWSAKHASGRQDPLRVVSASGRGRVLV